VATRSGKRAIWRNFVEKGQGETSRRACNVFSGKTRRLNNKLRPPQKNTSQKNTTGAVSKDEFYARFLNGDPDRKLTCSEILEIYEHSLAKLEASMQKAELR